MGELTCKRYRRQRENLYDEKDAQCPSGATAIRMAQLKTRSAADQKVADAVYDAEKFAKILRQRKPEGKRLTAEKTLSNILGIDIAETTGLLEDYDALMNEIPTPYQPISVQDQLFEVSP